MALANSYDSKLGRLFNVNNTLMEAKKALLLNNDVSYSDEIIYITENNSEVPVFVHPILDKTTAVYLDVRPFTTINKNGTLNIKNDIDYKLNLLRAQLELVWVRASHSDLYIAAGFSNEVFVRWLADIVIHKFGLDPTQGRTVLLLANFFNLGRYFNDMDSVTFNRHLTAICRDYYFDATWALGVAETLDHQLPTNIDEFIAQLVSLNISVRLKDLNARLFYEILGGSWFFAANSPQIVALAVEYPPAFISLVYMAVSYSMFKKTGIGGRVDRMNKGGKFHDFSRGILRLVETHTNVKE